MLASCAWREDKRRQETFMAWSPILLTTGACACARQQEFVIPVTYSQVFTVDSMSVTWKQLVNGVSVPVPRSSSTLCNKVLLYFYCTYVTTVQNKKYVQRLRPFLTCSVDGLVFCVYCTWICSNGQTAILKSLHDFTKINCTGSPHHTYGLTLWKLRNTFLCPRQIHGRPCTNLSY